MIGNLLAAYETAAKTEKGGVEFWREIKRKYPVVFAWVLAGLLSKDLWMEIEKWHTERSQQSSAPSP